ncbi:MAG: hypothetical protein AB7Q17_13535 [Phycisphaerae bacterium]
MTTLNHHTMRTDGTTRRRSGGRRAFAAMLVLAATAGGAAAQVLRPVLSSSGEVLDDGSITVLGEFAVGTTSAGSERVEQGVVPCWAGAAITPGDLNCDGVANNFDITPFVLALADPAAYAAMYPDCPILNADANGDGLVNNFDIDAFVALLVGP